MPFTREEGGRLNNFASEPTVYEATPPTKEEKRNYLILGILGSIVVVGLIFVAFSVSQVAG